MTDPHQKQAMNQVAESMRKFANALHGLKVKDYVAVTNGESRFHTMAGHIVEIREGEDSPYVVKLNNGTTARFAFAELESLGFRYEDRPAEMKKDRITDPLLAARKMVAETYYRDVSLDDIYVVWFSATLQNWKAMVSTNVKDNCYYEVTHNGNRNETYLDKYVKVTNYKIDHNTGQATGTSYDPSLGY